MGASGRIPRFDDLAHAASDAAVMLDNIRLHRPADRGDLSRLSALVTRDIDAGDLTLICVLADALAPKGAKFRTVAEVQSAARAFTKSLDVVAAQQVGCIEALPDTGEGLSRYGFVDIPNIEDLRDTCVSVSRHALAYPTRPPRLCT